MFNFFFLFFFICICNSFIMDEKKWYKKLFTSIVFKGGGFDRGRERLCEFWDVMCMCVFLLREKISRVNYAEGCDLSNQSLTDLSLSIDPDAMIFIVGWHAMHNTTSISVEEMTREDK